MKRSKLWLSLAVACGVLSTSTLYAAEQEAIDRSEEQITTAEEQALLDEEAVGQSGDDDDAGQDEADLERISVTGSLIKKTNADTLEPSIIIDAQTLRNRAINNVADILNETPAFGGPAAVPNGGQNGFSVGQSFVNFLGLGSSRTLTVVNGRRFVTSNAPTIFGEAGGLQVDLGALPAAFIESIETIGVGGAPTYGTDAIAGTVNVKYRQDFEGLELGVQYGLFDIGGEPENVQINAAWGANFADGRGNVAFAIEYNQQDEASNFIRPLFAFDEPTFREEGDGINRLFNDLQVQIVSEGGSISDSDFFAPSLGFGEINGQFLQFAPDGTLQPCEPGGADPESFFFAIGGNCGVDLFDVTSNLQSPLKRITATGIGHYDITDNVTAFFEFNAFNSEAEEIGNQAAFNTFAFPDDSDVLTFTTDNPFLTSQAQSTLAAAGLDTFTVNRLNQDLLGGGADFGENTTLRIVTGLNGGFNFLNRFWNWEAYTNFGSNRC